MPVNAPAAEAFFVTDDDVHFVATEYSRGPWDADACHGGPPCGLMVRAVERLVPDKQLVRLTAEIIRPVPMAGFRIDTEVFRDGRAVSIVDVRMTAGGKLIARAHAALHRAQEPFEVKNARVDYPDFAAARPGAFPVDQTLHGRFGFTNAVEIRYPPGETGGGPTTLWMRTRVPLLAGEESSGFQRICPLADCGNGVSWNEYFVDVAALNPDLTVVFHREPRGEWFAMSAISHTHGNGIGATEARLYDVHGPVGFACQGLLVTAAGRSPDQAYR